MTVKTYARPNMTEQVGSAYTDPIDSMSSVFSRFGAAFAPHEQDQGSPTPDLSVRVDAGHIFDGATLTEVAAQSVSGFTIPSAGATRIDRIVVDTSTGAASRVAGVEAVGSPSAQPPAIPAGKQPCARITITSSDTAISNSMITDERPFPL